MREWLSGMLIAALPGCACAQRAPGLIEITGYAEAVAGAEQDEVPVAILCDPGKARLSVRLADAASLDRSYSQRIVVAAESLIQPLPNPRGLAQYRGSLTRYLQCGPYSLRLSGGFYNANVEGRLGACPSFVSVDVLADNRMILSDREGGLAIGQCGREDDRGPICPANWAVRLDIAYQPQRKRVLVVEHVASNLTLADDPGEGLERTVRRYEADAPFSR